MRARRRALAAFGLACATVLLILVTGPGGARHSASRDRSAPSSGASMQAAPATGKRSDSAERTSGDNSLAAAERRLGTLIIARYSGPTPDEGLLERIRRGEVGGVILFGENTAGGTAATASAISLAQGAARAAGTYPLLVMTDQEGGTVKRLGALPPDRAPAEMTSAREAKAEGHATGLGLRKAGVNVDLAPVADVEQLPRSFLGTRSFGSSAAVVAARACAFADGLSEAGVIFTLKHFPGLGTASASTDASQVTVPTAASRLRANYAAYRRCGAAPHGLVMVSSAAYPSLDGSQAPAVTDPEIYKREMPLAHITLPKISDDLDTPALMDSSSPARSALDAGLDLLLYAGTESSSEHAYAVLYRDLRNRLLSPARVLAAADAVNRLKHVLPVRQPSSQRHPR